MQLLHIYFFVCICAIAVFFDLALRKVPNELILLGFFGQVLFLIFKVDAGFQLVNSWRAASFGAIGAFLLFLPLYVFRAMGAGDVKFFTVLGFCLGLGPALIVFVMGSVLAGLHALWVVLASRLGLVQVEQYLSTSNELLLQFRWWRWLNGYVADKHGGAKGIPYAAYLAIGAMLYVFWAEV